MIGGKANNGFAGRRKGKTLGGDAGCGEKKGRSRLCVAGGEEPRELGNERSHVWGNLDIWRNKPVTSLQGKSGKPGRDRASNRGHPIYWE